MSTALVTEHRARLAETERRQILLDAAEAVFLREGYAVATMDDVARGAGMSKRTLYQCFASKAELFEAVMDAALAPLRIDTSLAEGGPDLARALEGILIAAARHLLAPRQLALFRLVIAEAHRSPELARAFHRAGPGRGASSLELRIAAAVREGQLRPCDPKAMAEMLYGMALGSMHMTALLGPREPPEEAEMAVRIENAVQIFLHGVLTTARS